MTDFQTLLDEITRTLTSDEMNCLRQIVSADSSENVWQVMQDMGSLSPSNVQTLIEIFNTKIQKPNLVNMINKYDLKRRIAEMERHVKEHTHEFYDGCRTSFVMGKPI